MKKVMTRKILNFGQVFMVIAVNSFLLIYFNLV